MLALGYGLGKSIKIKLIEEALSHTYSSDIKFVHGSLYLNGYLWYLLAGAETQNPVKIDISDLSSYTGVTGTTGPGNTEIVYAKGYMWYPKDGYLNIRRTDITTLATVDFDGTGVNANPLLAPGLYYDSGTDCIFIGITNGFIIMDISNVDIPAFTFYDVKTNLPPGLGSSNFHSMTGDGTYIYMGFQYKPTGPYPLQGAVLKVKANDPAHNGTEGWISEYYTIAGFTDDVCQYGDYLYFAEDPHGTVQSHLRKINKSDLTEVRNATAGDIGTGYHGVWYHEGLLFTVLNTSPGTLKVYDLDLNEVYSYTFRTGYNLPNEITFSDLNTIFVTFWEAPALKVMKLKVIIP